MTQHVRNICRLAYIELRQIGFIRHLLTAQATQTLIHAFILPRLDYCNCLLTGCPQFLIDRLQKVQNADARLICRAKQLDHVQPILQSLHWLPIRAQIQYKISTLCFNVITGTGPHASPNFSICTLSLEISVPQQTQAFSRFLILIPKHLVRDHSHMSVPIPGMVCHTLSTILDSQTSFRQALKTHLFQQSF